MTNEQQVEVTQADREAAADFATRYLYPWGYPLWTCSLKCFGDCIDCKHAI
jgi:hypothetical protein